MPTEPAPSLEVVSPDEDRHSDAAGAKSAFTRNDDSRSVVRNVVVHYGAFVLQAVLALVTTPILLRALGETRFGLYSVVLTLAGYVTALELGVGVSTVRRIAAVGARGDDDELAVVMRTSLRLYTAISVVAGAVVVALIFALPRLVEGSDRRAQIALAALAASQILNLLCNVYPALLFGSGRFSVLSLTGLGFSLTSTVAQVAAALVTHDVLSVACVNAAIAGIQALVTREIARRRVPLAVSPTARFQGSVARALLQSGWKNALIGLCATAAYSSDVVIVGALLTLPAAAAYGIGGRAANLVLSIASRGSDVLVPTYAHHGTLGGQPRLFSLYHQSVAAAWLLTIPAGAVVLAAGEGLLSLWLGSVPDGSVDVLRIMVLTTMVSVPGANAFRLLSGIDRLGVALVTIVLAALANVGLSIVLTYQLGLVGPALGTLLVALVYDVVLMPAFACRVCGVGPAALLRSQAFLLLPISALALAAGSLSTLSQGLLPTLIRCFALPSAFLATAVVSMGGERRASYRRLLSRQKSGA